MLKLSDVRGHWRQLAKRGVCEPVRACDCVGLGVCGCVCVRCLRATSTTSGLLAPSHFLNLPTCSRIILDCLLMTRGPFATNRSPRTSTHFRIPCNAFFSTQQPRSVEQLNFKIGSFNHYPRRSWNLKIDPRFQKLCCKIVVNGDEFWGFIRIFNAPMSIAFADWLTTQVPTTDPNSVR